MITVYETDTFKNGERCVIDCLAKVDKRNLDVRHVVIVPDRASFEAERSLLKTTGGSFNVEVLTFRRFANKLLPQYAYLSKQAGIIALTGIIAEEKGNFVCYKKGVTTGGFAEELYDTVCRLKFCGISPERLLSDDVPSSIKGKLHDIGLVYKRYSEFLSGHFVDSADKMDLLRDAVIADETGKIAACHFYFYDFDNFSAQELAVIEQLMKKAKSVTVACCVDKTPAKKYLYLNDVYDGVMGIAKKNGLPVNEVERRGDDNVMTELLGKNLFSYGKPSTAENCGFATVFRGDTRVQEVYALACEIQKYVRSGGRFSDVFVVTSDLASYYNAIATVFDEFDVRYFCDVYADLATQAYVQFVMDFIAACRNNFRLQNVLPLVKNPLFTKGDAENAGLFENYCLKYNVSFEFTKEFTLGKGEGSKQFGEDPLYAPAEEVRKKLAEIISACAFERFDSASNYRNGVQKLIEFCKLDAENAALSALQKQYGFEVQSKTTDQCTGKFGAVLDQMQLLGDKVMSLDDFASVLSAAVASVNISVVPAKKDCVVVANMAKARKHNVRFLALLGANQGQMPIVQSDSRILCDADIEEMNKCGISVEPQIIVENKRERFSLYQILREPTDRLFVSYASADGNKALLPSAFVERIKQTFTEKGEPLAESAADENVYTERQAIGKLVLSERRLKDNRNVTMPDYSVLDGYYKEQTKKYAFEKDGKSIIVKRGRELYLGDQKTSISKITDFFSCPYKFYLLHGLSAKAREQSKLESNVAGTILHDALEKFVARFSLSDTDEETRILAEKCFEMATSDDFSKGLYKDAASRNLLKRLKKETVRMCGIVKNQYAETDFTQHQQELTFGFADSDYKAVQVDFEGGTFLLRGKIDRVDSFGDKFFVVDYKSGSSSATYNEGGLYSGEKLQLPIYVAAYRNATGKKPVGFYYLHLHDSFDKNDDESEGNYKFNGRTLADKDVAISIDHTIGKESGKRLPLRIGGQGQLVGPSQVSESKLNAEIEYAMKLIAMAGAEMSKGYAAVNPKDDACKFCDYNSVCDYNDLYVYPARKKKAGVDAAKIEEIVNGKEPAEE